MKKYTSLLSILVLLLLISTPFHVTGKNTIDDPSLFNESPPFTITSVPADQLPQAITVSDSDPFYALIATPLAIRYDESGTQHVIPLYVKNLFQPSKAVERAEETIGIYTDLILGDIFSPKDASLFVAQTFWQQTDAVLLIEHTYEGYELGMPAAPLASYLSIPIIVTNSIDSAVHTVLEYLQVDES